ncbi:DUF1819 family protein [Lachnospiraceae bacterium LCP25S3_G4]
MEYSAGIVSNLLWFVETRATAKLLCEGKTKQEIKVFVVSENLYQQKQERRAINQFRCIMTRLNALPDELIKELNQSDLATAKLIILVGAMATDRLLFEFVYEVYRNNIKMGENKLEDRDFNVFFQEKAAQSQKIAGWSESAIKKLKQTYSKYLFEAGLIEGVKENRNIVKVYVDDRLRNSLVQNNMEQYLFAMTGEN